MDQFIAQLLGLYFIVVGIIVILRRKAIMPMMKDLTRTPAVLLSLAAVELAAGLSLVLVYPSVEWSFAGVFSVIGYMLIIESIVYMASPAKVVKKFIGKFNTDTWLVSGGALALVAGAYLTSIGFGLL